MRRNQLKNVDYLQDRRTELRNNLTSAEATLWLSLKGSALAGRKFRRQHSIGNYIVDFYCPSERLIIELDGSVHDDPTQHLKDEKRTKWFERLDYKVVRFQNRSVFHELGNVLAEIERHFRVV